jgi:hypothetical protein
MLASRYGGLLFLLFHLLNPLLLTAEDRIRVSEERTRLVSNANGTVLKLAVDNDAAHDLPVHLELQTVDTSDKVIEVQSRDLILSHGSRELSIPLTKWDETHTEWMRVKYRVTPREAGSNVAEAQGVMSISEMSPQPFVLRLGLPSTAEKGARCRIHVFTQHPGSGLPVSNVSITAALTVEDDAGEHTLKAYSRSNSAGYAALDFDLPAAFEGHRAEIEVHAQSGRFTREASENLNFIDRSETVVTTDKPIYQPGQHLRVRVLAFDSFHKARAKRKMTVSIHDPENVLLQRTELLTSLFGEADMDWVIPDNARLGDYWIHVDSGDERPLFQRVKISRYDLPAFTITTRLDRSYYLPGQPSKVEVKADYLFGRPVNHGHVRVVRETSREWNYRDQKWEMDEERSIQGEFDSDGKFQAVVDLDDEQDRLSDRSYQRYSDLRYAVYVTDSTTNRTEERRFDVRITREPIHIYVGGDVRRQPKSLPLEFYVSAFYADGTPVKGRVSIHEAESGALLSSISTNKYGVGKVTGLRSGARQLTFTADDGKGAHGVYTESVSRDDSGIRVYPNKILYRQGEPIEVEIRSTFASGPVLLEVSTEENAGQSRLLQLRNGRVFTVIPYDAEFKDAVTIAQGCRHYCRPLHRGPAR